MNGSRWVYACVAIAMAATAGRGTFAEESPPTVSSRAVATVNGEAITEREVRMVAGPAADAATRLGVLQQLVIEKRIDQAARAAGIKVNDERLAAALKDRRDALGGESGYAAFLKRFGRTAEADRKELRRALEGEEYIARCLGESPDPKLLRPDLVRLLDIATVDVQTAWREHRDRFKRPGAVELAMVLVKKADHETPDAARLFLENLVTAHPPAALIEPTASRMEGVAASKKRLTSPEIESLVPVLRETARTGAVGAVSPIAETESAFLVVGVVAREPDVALEFAEACDLIRAWLHSQKRAEAVSRLCAELLAEATLWPSDLFSPRSG